MMYQILCGHVNYALGKTRMQVKNTKRQPTISVDMVFKIIIEKCIVCSEHDAYEVNQ
jgi:hypothetical protein